MEKDVEVKRFKEGGIKFTLKIKRKPLHELDEKSYRKYKPSHVDRLDDASPWERQDIKASRLQKEIKGFLKKPNKLQKRQLDAVEAKKLIKKLKGKYPDWSNEKISKHYPLQKYFDMLGKRQIMRIISEVSPGKVPKFGEK